MPAERETQHYMRKDGTGMMGPRHLSLIQEESGSRESTCVFPPIRGAQRPPGVERGREIREWEEEEEEEEGERGGEEEGERKEEDVCVKEEKKERERGAGAATLALGEENRRQQDSGSLLEELTLLEAGMRQSVRLEDERQRERQFLRAEDNRVRWQSLLHLSLDQRVTRPWVSSYFRKFPMHIYCLPIRDAPRRTIRTKSKTSRR